MINDPHVNINQIILKQRLSIYNKTQSSFKLCFNHGIPSDVFQGEEWDASPWTQVATDEAIVAMIHENGFKSPVILNLSGAVDITDVALQSLARVSGKLQLINLQSVSKISEKGIHPVFVNSRVIQSLNLSGCIGIAGSAFALVGQYCKTLKELNVSRCHQITSWAFTKIFEGCNDLRIFDCSFNLQLMDNELRILGHYSKCLESVNLAECIHVSDIGVAFIADGCRFLRSINLSRTDLVMKISDISLLSLSDNCHELVFIDLTGCQNVTDTGIAWLFSGCKKLQHLGLSNCRKVTNRALRYIGESCRELKSLYLTNMNQVSDIGIRHILDGCHHIEHLHLSGLCLLSNSDKCTRKNGLHALAASGASRTIKSINLDRCPLVGHSTLLTMALLSQMENLSLSYCPNLSVDGMAAIARGCGLLQQICLKSCGRCITDEMIKALRPLFLTLTHLDLTGCDNIGILALRELSHFHRLSHLNLSGCTGVDDNGIFALCEGDFHPGIRNLYLDRCFHVTNLSLSWITDSLKDRTLRGSTEVTLETLSFKDTKITASFAEGFIDRFRYSTFKKNNNIFGFFALPRAKQMRIIFDYDRRVLSIIKIQSVARAWKHRKIAEKIKQRYNMAKVSTLLGAVRRRQLAKKCSDKLRRERWLRWKMVMKIQCWYRVKMALRLTAAMRRKRWLLVAPYAALTIQTFIRRVQGRQIALLRSKQIANQYQAAVKASIEIQLVFRKHRRLQQAVNQLKNRRLELSRKNHTAVKMQSLWRRFMAKRISQRLRKENQLRKEKIVDASRLIVRCFRSAHLRRKIHERVIHKETINERASIIQRWFMTLMLEERQRLINREKLNRLKFHSAVVIQMTWRGKLACNWAIRLRESLARHLNMKTDMATRLSLWWRCCLARRHVAKLRLMRREELKCRLRLEIWASTTICALWRGHLGRLKAIAARESRAKRWIKCWNEDHGRFFYHDQITGQSQWQKPLEVLETEQRPICSNCSFYEAKVECSDCMEYFCFTCWDAVHFGGKRSRHEFRSLYDFYGKRVSYELTSCPSNKDDNLVRLWPSEIEQDECSVHLRVTPYRTPSARLGDWSVYHDDDTKRIFYHNIRTDERQYD